RVESLQKVEGDHRKITITRTCCEQVDSFTRKKDLTKMTKVTEMTGLTVCMPVSDGFDGAN
ncbi:MAG: hypothetical protein JSW53_02735, partial [Candidatus Bathyarchaeota archaeon]